MAITRGQVTLQEAGTISKRLQTVARVDGGTSDPIHNEVHCLIDPNNANDTAICNIINLNPTGTEYGIVTRPIPGTSIFHIDDNAGSVTVDSPVGTPLAVRLSDGTNFFDLDHTQDFDTGAPVVNKVSVGLIVPASGGPVIIGGSAANGLQVDVTRVQGTVTVGGTVTISAAVGTPAFVELSDGAAVLKGQKAMASSLPVVIASDQTTIPTDDRRGLTLLFAKVDVAGAGDNAIVAADATRKIKVVSYAMVADGTVAAKWRSATTDLSGAMSLVANSGIAMSEKAGNWLLETAVNQALNINLSGAVGLRGHISYFLE